MLASQWDKLSKQANGGFYRMDSLHWFNYVAFDIIGDLAFGAPFGMLENGKDIAEVRATPDSPPTYAPAIEVLNRRGEVSNAIGIIPWIKPYAKYLPDPFFTKGVAAVQNLAGIAIARVNQRLEAAERGEINRVDLLARLMEGKDENGNKLGRAELTAEALTQLIAGSDTTSNTSCALLFHMLQHPACVKKLQAELDEALPSDDVPSYEQVKNLPYLDMVIQETLRIHSTSSQGLPRTVPPGPGVDLAGHHFPQGTVLSVPAYTMHHSKEIWGKDADEFRPERWEKVTERYAKHPSIESSNTSLTLVTDKRAPSSPSPTARALASAATSPRYGNPSSLPPESPTNELTSSPDGTLPHRLDRLPPLRVRAVPEGARDARGLPA